jgi:hypothetical protein
VVGRDVDAVLHDEEVSIAPGAVVGGEVRTHPAGSHRDHYLAHYASLHFYLWVLVQLVGAFLFGLLVHALAPRVFPPELPDTPGFFRAMGLGFAVVVVTPVAIALCALTVVGIPVAVLASFAFATALYGGVVAVGALVGRALVAEGPDGGRSFGVVLLAGVSAVTVAVHLPILGIPLAVVTVLTGMGLLVQHARRLYAAPMP